MKPTNLFLLVGLFSLSFQSDKNQPIYKIIIDSADCFFDVTLNDKFVYTNRNSYKVNRTLKIDKFIEKKDSQKLFMQLFPTTHKKSLTEKTKLNLIIIKEWKGKVDTIHQSKSSDPGFTSEGKTSFAQRMSSTYHFETH